MFTKGKGSEPGTKQSATPAQNAIRPASAKPTARSAPSIISSDMLIKGSVTSDGEMQIDGKIEGDVAATSITIGQTGAIQGEVKAQTVIVRGRIIGSVRARKVELESGAHVEGDIVHASLAIQSNAVFQGQVKHADDPLKQSAPAAQAAGAQVSTSAPAASGDSAKPADDKAPNKITSSGGFGVPN